MVNYILPLPNNTQNVFSFLQPPSLVFFLCVSSYSLIPGLQQTTIQVITLPIGAGQVERGSDVPAMHSFHMKERVPSNSCEGDFAWAFGIGTVGKYTYSVYYRVT